MSGIHRDGLYLRVVDIAVLAFLFYDFIVHRIKKQTPISRGREMAEKGNEFYSTVGVRSKIRENPVRSRRNCEGEMRTKECFSIGRDFEGHWNRLTKSRCPGLWMAKSKTVSDSTKINDGIMLALVPSFQENWHP